LASRPIRWFWSIFIVPATPGVTNGTAATREEAFRLLLSDEASSPEQWRQRRQ
jgi:hypothetical protein